MRIALVRYFKKIETIYMAFQITLLSVLIQILLWHLAQHIQYICYRWRSSSCLELTRNMSRQVLYKIQSNSGSLYLWRVSYVLYFYLWMLAHGWLFCWALQNILWQPGHIAWEIVLYERFYQVISKFCFKKVGILAYKATPGVRVGVGVGSDAATNKLLSSLLW